MGTQVRTALLAFAFLATTAAVITGATLRGESKESPEQQICASATWPMIPANCLEGGKGRDVRPVGADVDAFDAEADAEAQEERGDMQIRFAADFN
jgi:hypothetical protein